MLFGVGLPDENAHAPNEKLDLANFHNGIIASAYLYDEISQAMIADRRFAGFALNSDLQLQCQFSDATRRRSDLTCSQICVLLVPFFLVESCLARQAQVALQVAQRGREVVQVIREKPRSRSSLSADGSTASSSSVMSRACGNENIRT